MNTKQFQYTNNTEYRQCVRTLFSMDMNKYTTEISTTEFLNSLDDETLDEITYDEDAATKTLDTIYNQTRINDIFKNIYILAAGKMLSQDPEIGLAVLMSYNYLKLFYPCLLEFLENPTQYNEQSPSYVALMKKLV